jgi:hypothetical protein
MIDAATKAVAMEETTNDRSPEPYPAQLQLTSTLGDLVHPSQEHMDDTLLRFGGSEVGMWSVTSVKRGESAGSEGNGREGFVNQEVIDAKRKIQ